MALPLKSGADLYNNQALRLRLHNLGADPTEVGAGLIYFNTSTGLNTSQKARLYTGSAWKTIAFSEDLDVASNADFLALKDKVDTLIGDGVDMDGIIESWKEVEAFLSGMSDTQNLMDYLNTELGKKLDKSGGTITSNTYNGGLTLKRNASDTGVGLWFANNTGSLGALFCTHDKELQYHNGTSAYTLIHSGNIRSQIVEGINNHSGEALDVQGNIDNLNAYYSNGAFKLTRCKGLSGLGTKNTDGIIVNWPLDHKYGQQWYIDDESHTIQVRHVANAVWSDWKTIAFTDSNVASATKLETPRTIWGQSFDGTGDVDGALENVSWIQFTGTSFGIYQGVTLNSALTSNDIALYSQKVYMSGNVLIGTTEDNGAKLQVAGDLHVKGNIIADGEVSAGGAGEEGGNAGGGGAFHSESIAVGATQTTIAHGLGTDDIVVSIYEKDGVSGRWSLILTDVEVVDANNIIVSFGSATTVEHKVVIMGAVA